jgi:syntaxin 18
MKNSSRIIRNLRTETEQAKISDQTREHQTAVINLLEKYMKEVCDIYSEQKAIRVKRAFEKQRMSRLELVTGSRRRNLNLRPDDNRIEPNLSDERNRDPASSGTLGPPEVPRKASDSFPFVEEPTASKSVLEEGELAAEELQLFDEENSQLFDELNALTDEVRQIGGKVIEIAHLQEVFTEKVLQQEQDLNRLNETVVGSTETIRGGNEQLREAMKSNAGFRVWILFFIITLAFTVLFLDWYNP